MTATGAIAHEEAYVQSKMLDHSAWQNEEPKLPRGITGSDVDFGFERTLGAFGSVPVFDNDGSMIFIELTRGAPEWRFVSTGQRLVYQALIMNTPHCAVVCQHDVPLGKAISTRHDIQSFQLMFHDHGFVYSPVISDKDSWQGFIFSWFESPVRFRRYYLGRSAGNGKR